MVVVHVIASVQALVMSPRLLERVRHCESWPHLVPLYALPSVLLTVWLCWQTALQIGALLPALQVFVLALLLRSLLTVFSEREEEWVLQESLYMCLFQLAQKRV